MNFFKVLGNIFLVILKIIGGMAKGLFCIGGILGISSFFGNKD